MTIQNIELKNVQISSANPRKTFDNNRIEGLAESIHINGLLQNLVVQPIEGKEGKYSVVSGERRLRALRELAKQGHISKEYKIPAIVRDNLTKDEALRVATVENVQRENLTALEEAAAFATLVKNGDTLAEIAAQTGLSSQIVKRRCALNGLCKEAKKALVDKEINLSQAEALTLGSNKAQQRILEHIGRGYGNSADDIRETIIGGKPTVSMAIFPVSTYGGKFATDLFTDSETTYFEDEDQFFKLQQKAVQELAEYYYRSTAAKWVDVTENYHLSEWQYDEVEEGQPYGILINFSPSGDVEIKGNLVKPDIDEETKEETASKPKKVRPLYSKPVCEYVAWHKSMAVQETLLTNSRKVQELTVLSALERLYPHKSFDKLADLPDQQRAYGVIEKQANRIIEILGFEPDNNVKALGALIDNLPDTATLYELLKPLSDEQLNEVLEFVTIIEFGQSNCEIPDQNKDSLFNLVATDIQVEMRNHWTPCITFLNGRTQAQLVEVAKQCGYIGYVSGYKKTELVNCLLKHFENSEKAGQSDEREQKLRDWLPSIMFFPAVLPKEKQKIDN